MAAGLGRAAGQQASPLPRIPREQYFQNGGVLGLRGRGVE